MISFSPNPFSPRRIKIIGGGNMGQVVREEDPTDLNFELSLRSSRIVGLGSEVNRP